MLKLKTSKLEVYKTHLHFSPYTSSMPPLGIWSLLPTEISHKIFLHLDIIEIIKIIRPTCSLFRQLTATSGPDEESNFWSQVFNNLYKSSPILQSKIPTLDLIHFSLSSQGLYTTSIALKLLSINQIFKHPNWIIQIYKSHRNNYIYEGQIDPVTHKRDGLGKINIKNDKTIYIGQWQLNKRHGYGYIIDNGRKYKGDWMDGKRHGWGKEKNRDGSKYIGSWRWGKREGIGECKWIDGTEYKGRWKKGKRNGEGVFVCGDGKVYEGRWKRDVPNGKGCYRSDNWKIEVVWSGGEITFAERKLEGMGTEMRRVQEEMDEDEDSSSDDG
eukprot:TRINITY_DN2993_c0_g1_i1.p1 TRINITY_DN2993_c0_g1~~TRINITY_DN2993_c0_g1_i1.p1  ORF type:complete len:327 (-),score=87.50 TRINITY_DN2993_c0_g1_i1:94-1074(-)